jgi:hypothetical protein
MSQKELKDCCQVCKNHRNKPSRCVAVKGCTVQVARKETPCTEYFIRR